MTVILSTPSPTATDPHPFATAVKDWTSKFVGELVAVLSTSLNGGVNDAAFVIQFYLQQVNYFHYLFLTQGNRDWHSWVHSLHRWALIWSLLIF